MHTAHVYKAHVLQGAYVYAHMYKARMSVLVLVYDAILVATGVAAPSPYT